MHFFPILMSMEEGIALRDGLVFWHLSTKIQKKSIIRLLNRSCLEAEGERYAIGKNKQGRMGRSQQFKLIRSAGGI